MKLKRIYGVFTDEHGHDYLVPLKLNAVKKLNGRVIEASVLFKLVDGVKKWSKRAAK